jgi:beta-glucosidase
MFKKLLLLFYITLSLGCSKQSHDKNFEIDHKVEALLAQMTLEEKVGQMTQITLNVISKGTLPYDVIEPHEIDEERLQDALVNRHVGSIFNVGHHAFSREHWHEILTHVQHVATTQTRLKIPVLYGIDAVHGTNYTHDSTFFPQQIGLAATWNPTLLEKVAAITAYETRAIYIPWNFSPNLDVARNPLHSRFYETFGEDNYLVKELGKAMLHGYQGDNVADKYKIAATLKHFIGYTAPLSGIDRSSAWIPEHYLREYFLPPFADAIHHGAKAIMLNLSEINGIPVHTDAHLISDILRNELKFKGLVVSDWEAVREVFFHHHVAVDDKAAVKLAVDAGIDMSMVPYDFSFAEHLLALVKEGQVSVKRINESVRRILKFKFELGLFEHPFYPAADYPQFASEAFRQVSQQAAAESITLLKNKNNVLPLPKTAKVLVTGFAANSMRALNGGWSYTWQGADTDYHGAHKLTILEAMVQKIGADNVHFVEAEFDSTPQNIEQAVDAAQQADYIILCLGELSYAENFGNLQDLNAPEGQVQLARQLAATGKPVILVLTEGRPRVINAFETQIQAVLMAYLPSNEGGLAIADTLFGEVNPSGKLPFTYPLAANMLVHYDHKYSENYAVAVQYPFGFGLSYTTFSYKNLVLDKTQLQPGETLTVSVEVTNTGTRSGQEVVQLYSGDVFASVAPSVKRLRRFRKIELPPEQTQTVTFTLSPEDFAFITPKNHKLAERGTFEITVGELKATFELMKDIDFSSTACTAEE